MKIVPYCVQMVRVMKLYIKKTTHILTAGAGHHKQKRDHTL